MPIAVACTCGKQFRVRDDQAGTLVNCQVCGAQCQVPLSDAVGVIAPPAAKLVSAPLEIENTINCPACAEKIPAASRKCPLCSEVLKADNADSIRFKNPKIEHAPKVRHFSDAKSFKAYWKQIFSGPSPYNRNLTLKNVHVVGRSGNVVVVEGTLNVTSYNSLLLLLIFLNWLIALIVVLVTQQKDELRLRKALINHRGKWYILDGAFESQVDRSM
jgi:hypothetical protein